MTRAPSSEPAPAAPRVATAAAAVGYAAFLLLLPALAYGAGHPRLSLVGAVGAVLLLAHAATVWRRYGQALATAAAAQAKSEALLLEAQRAVQAKSAFVAMVSHELRTPLSGVLAAGGQLEGQTMTPAAREAVAVVNDAGRFMHALLDDLLDLAKLEAGKMTTEAVAFDLGRLVWSIERHWGAAAVGVGRSVQLTSAIGLPRRVTGDPTRLRQVLNNLLSNAVKFTGPAGVTWTVDVCEGAEGCALTVRVTDTGPGIAPDKLDRLFTAFDQTDATVARTHGGTGLGLALSRELARVMGGELSVESRVGQGSTFVLRLPLGRAEAISEPEASLAVEPEQQAPLRLLVVDDHEINRRTMALLLEPSGAAVTLTGCAEEAFAALAFDTFDVILTDLQMPEMDGFAFTRALRAGMGPNRRTPVVAVSGSDSETDRAKCLDAGMVACVPKPVDPRTLYAALEAAVASQAADGEAAAA